MKRCEWVTDEPIYISYHDKEWGRPLYDSDKLFEMLCLEGMQAGLSWITILKRRENYRQAFDHFQADVIAKYTEEKVNQLLQDKGIIRNRRKIEAIINNAKVYLEVRKEYGNFSDYIWSFVDGKPIINAYEKHEDVPAFTELSKAMSKDLKKRGFKFVGETICYAFMQASGMVNDHLIDCFCYNDIRKDEDFD
ncbi:DNA-3-methyladenine glycosylase I [Scopulibacillus darangshiensis]|uniref:DNA-3-methyladenine glycosylase I n=1 Tax=Scopulibacillus darangshiensis TaxID=442528 RepID=A0A4R2P9M7_9BACL|nr:DNA-3-methyladenine glycosylase I [Scopulibacillus darangshiensis]TCP31739.1 DNA-3-methyladenine glycosylase I [Scopulibacillus darangshiensis]